MGTPIYKISEYVDWQSLSPVLGIYSGAGAAIPPEPSGGGLNGAGVAGRVAFWLDEDTLTNDAGFTYEVDSGGIGLLTINGNLCFKDDDSSGGIGTLPLADSSIVNVVMYDPATGLLSYGTGGGESLWEADSIGDLISVTTGAGIYVDGIFIKDSIIDAQDGSLKHLTVTAGDASGVAGTDAGDLYLKAGASLGTVDSISGKVYIVPGNNSYTTAGYTYIGDGSSNITTQYIAAVGIDSTTLILQPSGTGYVGLHHLSGPSIYCFSTNIWLDANAITLGTGAGTCIIHPPSGGGTTNGQNITIYGGESAPSYNGGNIYLYGGPPNDSGTEGDVYIGTGSAGKLKSAASGDDYIVTYNPTTGKLSYIAI